VLAEINGMHLSGPEAGKPLASYTQMRADGSTSGGCWIYTGVYADGINHAADRTPGQAKGPGDPAWGWVWPSNRRILYNRASADPDGKPWSERKKYVWWDAKHNRWTGQDVPDFAPGDTLRVAVRVREGDKERLQAFEGVCIARKGGGASETFTVRKVSSGIGVERIFPLHSPSVESITVVRRGRVRRAKLYYLRALRGKAARIREKTQS